MFPTKANDPYINKNGSRSTLGAAIGSGGGGGSSFTPDYENEILEIGTVGDWAYYIPMSKTYLGPTTSGYEITTKSTSQYDASLDLYAIEVNSDSVIVSKTLIKNIPYQGTGAGYSDDNIEISYISNWSVTLKSSYADLEGNPVSSPITWAYSETKDLKIVEV